MTTEFTPGTKLELTGWGTVVEGLNGRLDLLTKPGGALLDLALLTGPGGFEAEPVIEYQQVGSLFEVRIPDGGLRATVSGSGGGSSGGDGATPTLDSLLRSTAPHRVAAMAAQREAFDALFPPQPPATGWRRVRQSLGDAVSNARTRVALTIAPWLEIR